MGVRANGSAYCNRCNKGLPGVGVLYGMLATDMAAEGTVRQLTFCYDEVNQCRDAVLTGHLSFATSDPNVCADCGLTVDSADVAHGMLVADLNPVDLGVVRRLLFCYANGSRDRVLDGRILY